MQAIDMEAYAEAMEFLEEKNNENNYWDLFKALANAEEVLMGKLTSTQIIKLHIKHGKMKIELIDLIIELIRARVVGKSLRFIVTSLIRNMFNVAY